MIYAGLLVFRLLHGRNVLAVISLRKLGLHLLKKLARPRLARSVEVMPALRRATKEWALCRSQS
jgi:hypothetical protein